MKKNRKMLWVVLVGIALGSGWWMAARRATELQPDRVAVVERPAAEQDFLDAVLESPERLDATVAEPAEPAGGEPTPPVCTLQTGSQRHLLSDVEKPSAPQPLKEPVAAESLYFWKDYASLRTDAIRNPDSPENRAGVVALMQARQRRLGQNQ